MTKLYSHQKAALEKLENGSILWGGVGSGKSLVAMAYYDRHERPKNVCVITTAKKRQSLDWMKEAANIAIGAERLNPDDGVIVVDSWNNAFFIFDEQRLVGNGAWVKSFLKIAERNTWLLLSATPGDTWSDYIPVFLAHGYYKNRTEFSRRHIVYNRFAKYPKIDRYVDTGHLVALRNKILVHMPYERHTRRIVSTVPVKYDKELYETIVRKRWNPFEERPIKDVSELFVLMRKVVNSDPSRFLKVRELLEKHPRLIIFYNFNYELEALRKLAEDVPLAEWNGHKHEELPEGDRWVYLVQYTAGFAAHVT